MSCAAFPLCTTGATLRDEKQERQTQSAATSAAALLLRRQVIVHAMSSLLVLILLLPICLAWPNATANATGPALSAANGTAANGTVVVVANSTETVLNNTDLAGLANGTIATNASSTEALRQFATGFAPANAAAQLLPPDETGTNGPDGLPNSAVLTKVTQFSPVGPGRIPDGVDGLDRLDRHADRARDGFIDRDVDRIRPPDDRGDLRPDALLDPAKIHLVPAGMPFLMVDYDKTDTMLFEVAQPKTDFIMCTSNNAFGRQKCSGEIDMDLSSSNGELEIAFQAPDGYEIEIDNNGGKLELAIRFSNLGHLFSCGEEMRQSVRDFIPEVTGSRIDGLTSPEIADSVLKMDPCSVSTSVELTLSETSSETIRFKRISWMVPYTPRLFRRQKSKLTYKTNTAMWIKGNNPRLVEG